MNNGKAMVRAYSTVKTISESFDVKITNEMSYENFFSSCVEKMKLSLEKVNIRNIIKIIDFLEQGTDPLEGWEQEILTVLYKRKQQASTLD